MTRTSIIDKLKTRWQVESALQVVLILIVFSCTGTSVVMLKGPLYHLAGIDASTPAYIRIPFYIFTVLPAYQVLLLAYGFVFGQFRFFWNFEKKTWSRIRNLFSRKQKTA
jgi:hypothetical protein